MTDGATEAKVAPRRWWAAALLALPTLGVGYLYVGRPRRALAYAVLSVLLASVLWYGFGGWIARPFVAFFVAAGGIGFTLFAIVDAIRIARRSSNYSLRWYNRWWIYLSLVLIPPVVANLDFVIPGFPSPTWPIRSFSMSSGSGLPTLRLGDHMIADLHAYDREAPRIGDLIVFALPRDPSVIYVKRIAAGSGDRIQIRGGVAFINGEEVKRDLAGSDEEEGIAYQRCRETWPNGASYEVLDRGPNQMEDDTAVFEVPAENYFVLGDNRDNSTDSRIPSASSGVGYVPRANIIGRLTWISWSSDLSRIGTSLE